MKELREMLKLNIMEDQFPFFSDKELDNLLIQNGRDLRKSSYQACLMKAQNSEISAGPISIGSNEEFWIRLARAYAPVRTGGMKRSDEL